MRENLFRGKTTAKEIAGFNGVWVYGDLIVSDGKKYIHPQNNRVKIEGELGKIIIMHEVISETIGEYTGLPDKNGTKIFAGDIVSLGDLAAIRICGCYVIKFNQEQARYSLYTANGIEQVGFNKDTMKAYNVLGNIHDNPELLENNNDK